MGVRDKASIRSRTMAACRSRDTRPERRLRSYLHRKGFRFRLCVKSLPGTPDIVLPRYRTAVFMDGCFWHGHVPCRSYLPPLSRRDYWRRKVSANRARDRRQSAELREAGWTVIRVRECELRDERVLSARLAPLQKARASTPCRSMPGIRLRDRSLLAAFFFRSLWTQAFRLARRAVRERARLRRTARAKLRSRTEGRTYWEPRRELLEGLDAIRFRGGS